MQIKDKIRTVSDLAFEAVDTDGSNSLDKNELAAVMKEVAQEMKVTPPTDADILSVLLELDDDFDGTVSKDEFLQLIILVLGKMLESEEDLEDNMASMKQSSNFLGRMQSNIKGHLDAALANTMHDKD